MIEKVFILLFTFCKVVCIKRQTNCGLVLGRVTTKAQIFQGIPFADAKRWEDPKHISCWRGVYDATSVKPMCTQPPCTNAACQTTVIPETSEHCLFLNIFAPRCTRKRDRKAVMVWIHGGFFVFQTGAAKMYDGEEFVNSGDVILVTINYRLGVFGFLYNGKTIDGNFGLKDQIMALEWVQKNIWYFGGDSKKVTVFGQSAGAASIAALLISRRFASLFRNAILQSAPVGANFKSKPEALAQFSSFATNLGCDVNNKACMELRTAQEVLIAMANTSTGTANVFERFGPWEPLVDGNLLKYTVVDAAEKGCFADKPIIIGITVDEGDKFNILAANTISKDLFKGTIRQWRTNTWEADYIIERYLDPTMNDQTRSLAEVSTDFIFVCPSYFIAEKLSPFRNIWTYIFNHTLPYLDPPCNHRVCHGNERSFVFNSFDAAGLPATNEDRHLGNKIITFWTNFAKYGNPNGKRYGEKYWPHFVNTDQLSIVLEAPTLKVHSAYKEEICAFWNAIGYNVTSDDYACDREYYLH